MSTRVLSPRRGSILLVAAFLLSPLICLFRPAPASGTDFPRLASWLAATLCFVGLLAVSGSTLRDFKSGLLIGSRNRYSLSRLQMTAWTVLAIPAILVALGANALRAVTVTAAPPLVLDWTLVALMGISLTSFVATPLMLSARAEATPDPARAHRGRAAVAEKQGLPHDAVCSEGSLITKASPADARFSDFVTGEEVGNATTLDLSRIQMLAMTLIVWVVYAVLLGRVLGADGRAGWTTRSFPTFDTTLLALLAISHAGYISGKITPKTPGAADDAANADVTTRAVARVSTLATDAASLTLQITATLDAGATRIAGDRQLAALKDQADAIRTGVDDLRKTLADGGNAAGTLDALEGKLATVTALFRALVGQGGRPQLADEPSPELVAQVKAAVGGLGTQSFTAGSAWLPSDQAALEAVVKDLGLQWGDLARPRYRAFEDVLELVRPPAGP